MDGFVRTFMLPGVAHCAGGKGQSQVDFLSTIVDWVEFADVEFICRCRVHSLMASSFTGVDAGKGRPSQRTG